MFSVSRPNKRQDPRSEISTAQVRERRHSVEELGPHLLGETSRRKLGLPGHDTLTKLFGHREKAPVTDWGYAAAPTEATATGNRLQKKARTVCFEHPRRNTLSDRHRPLHQSVDLHAGLTIGKLQERLASSERQSERLRWQCSSLRGQLDAAVARATAAEDRARVAEEAARTAAERTRILETAMVRLTEEAASIRAAASPAAGTAASFPVLPVVSGGQGGSVVSAGPPPDFMAMLRTSWEPLQCQEHILTEMYESFAQRYRAARNALEPGSRMLRVEEEIGRGGFGGVHKAVCATTGEEWAIKKPVTEAGQKALIYEILVYRSLPVHPNILRVHSVYDRLPCPALALECGKCDFSRALANGLMSFSDELECMADIAEGTGHCHGSGIVICDLKPSNVILVHDGTRYVGKVADFGLARGIGQTRAAQCGSPGYFPPEVAHSSTLAEPSTDAVSVGAMLATVALKAAKRETNVFTHRMFRTPKEGLRLQQLAQTDDGRFRNLLVAITLRTMQLPDYGFAKKVTRPSVLNKMPAGSLTALRKMIRSTTSCNPADRPAMTDLAPELRFTASNVRRVTERAGSSAPTGARRSSTASSNATTTTGSMGSARGSSDSYGVSVSESGAGIVPPPHLLSFGGNHTGSVSDFGTMASFYTQQIDKVEQAPMNAGVDGGTPSATCTGGRMLDRGNRRGSAAPPLASTGPGMCRVAGASVRVTGGDGGVSACGSLEGILLLGHGPPFTDLGRDSGSVIPVRARAPGATGPMGTDVKDPCSGVVTRDASRVVTAGGRGGWEPTAPIHHKLGVRLVSEKDKAAWEWGWEWKGERRGSVAVGFDL